MLNLPRNIVFSDAGYFYNIRGEVEPGTEANGYKLKVDDDDGNPFEATFIIPKNMETRSNCEILMEHYPDLMQKKSSYTHLFNTIPNQQNADLLEKLMNSIYKSMMDALLFADKLYWLDRGTKVRTDKTLDYCLAQGLKVAQVELETEKIINDISLPEVMVKQNLEDDFEALITTNKRTIGIDIADAAEKDKPIKLNKPRKSNTKKVNKTKSKPKTKKVKVNMAEPKPKKSNKSNKK